MQSKSDRALGQVSGHRLYSHYSSLTNDTIHMVLAFRVLGMGFVSRT
jgi:hypothetical protein